MARVPRALLAAAVAALLLAGPAAAQTTPPDLNKTVDHGQSILDQTLHGIGSAAKGVGQAAGQTGKGVGHAGSALGQAFAAAAKAVGDAAVASARFLGQATVSGGRALAAVGLLSAVGLAGAALAIGSALGGLLSGLGALSAVGVGGAVAIVGSSVAWAAGALASAITGYVGFVVGLRPHGMPIVAFGAVAVTGATASAGIGSWAGWAALKKWGWVGPGLGGMAGFTRIDDSELLEHPLRAQVFQVIQENPGIHASGLARQVGVGWGTITHHLEKLEKGQLVAVRKVNNQKCFFEQGGKVSRQDMAIASAVKGDTAGTIAGYVTGHPMTSQKAMAASLGISPALVSFHVKKLVNLGVLEKVRHGKETLLTTSEALRRVLTAEASPAAHAELKDESFQFSS